MKKQKSFLASNLKFLRERQKKTQTNVAEALNVTRAKINAFENEVNLNPTVDDLLKFTEYFKISVDSLLWINLKRLGELQLRNLEAGNDEYIMGTKIRVLATTVDSKNRENIEIVPIKAKAGYATGYSNPEFVGKLESFQLPVLTENRKFRMFQIEGESMLPYPDKSFVICEFIENWTTIKDGLCCIILTKDDGIIFKKVYSNFATEKNIRLRSLNPLFKEYTIHVSNIKEIWKYSYHLSSTITDISTPQENIGAVLSDFKQQILDEIKTIKRTH